MMRFSSLPKRHRLANEAVGGRGGDAVAMSMPVAAFVFERRRHMMLHGESERTRRPSSARWSLVTRLPGHSMRRRRSAHTHDDV